MESRLEILPALFLTPSDIDPDEGHVRLEGWQKWALFRTTYFYLIRDKWTLSIQPAMLFIARYLNKLLCLINKLVTNSDCRHREYVHVCCFSAKF